MGTGTIIIILIVVVVIIAVIQANLNSKKRNAAQQNLGINPKSFFNTGRYTCGHPDLDKPIEKTEMALKDGDIQIFSSGADTVPIYQSKIPIDKIKNITIEDASMVQRRVTVGRMLAVGIFAFAWKKKKVDEISYLIIEWNDGKFDHETIFEFTEKGAVQKSNEARNKLIKIAR